MHGNNQDAYDKGFALFAPDGRLHQVEFARKAVERASPAVGIQTEHGVVLAAQNTRVDSPLLVSESIEKIHKIESTFGMTAAGHITDGRKLAEELRQAAQDEKEKYGSIDDTSTLVYNVADHIQETTQSNALRPYGVALLVGGVDYDDTPTLYRIEPDGAPSEWRATAIGKNSTEVAAVLEDQYEATLTIAEATQLSLHALVTAGNVHPDEQSISVATITADDEFVQMDADDVADKLDSLDNITNGDENE